MSLTKVSFSMITGAAFNVADYGAVGNGSTDDTAAVNAAILAAYLSKASQASPTDETYDVEVRFVSGKDYKITGPILLPSGITLNGNGCRLVGNYASAVSTAYNDSAPSLIETAYYNGSAIVTNRAAALATNRVVGSTIKGFAFSNANCAINAINMNEQCSIEGCTFNNVSAAMRLKCCFYLSVSQHTIRSSSQAAGQASIALLGGNHNSMTFSHVACVGPAIGISVNGASSFATSIISCTFEEGKAYNSVGILFGADAYCAGWNLTSNYIEGVKYGFSLDSGASVYGSIIETNIFNNNQYAIICSGSSNLRLTNIFGNSLPDDGGTNRNLIEASNSGNDVFLQIPSKSGKTSTGNTSFLTNFTLGNAGYIEATSAWLNDSNTTQALARSQPAQAAQNSLNIMPFEGANILTVSNQVPFCVAPVLTSTTAVIDTALTYDISNALVFNFRIQDFVGTYNLHGTAYGTTVYRNDANAPTVAVSNNSGIVRVTIGNINTNSGASFVIQGMIRHF
jgi:hypothetical protein